MAENLVVTHYQNGDEIPNGLSDSEWDDASFGAYSIFMELDGIDEIYGNLYNYYAVTDDRGICPEGWHIPTDYEVFIMENYIDPTITDPNLKHMRGVDAGIKLAEGGSSGFDCLYSGYRYYTDGSFMFNGEMGWFFTSTIEAYNPAGSFFRRIEFGESGIVRNACYKEFGLPVRCLKDD